MTPSDSADRLDNLSRSPAECRRTDRLAVLAMAALSLAWLAAAWLLTNR